MGIKIVQNQKTRVEARGTVPEEVLYSRSSKNIPRCLAPGCGKSLKRTTNYHWGAVKYRSMPKALAEVGVDPDKHWIKCASLHKTGVSWRRDKRPYLYAQWRDGGRGYMGQNKFCGQKCAASMGVALTKSVAIKRGT